MSEPVRIVIVDEQAATRCALKAVLTLCPEIDIVGEAGNSQQVYDFFMQPVPQEGTGSGFVYDTDGRIVTNYHVVENAQELLVTLADGRTFPAQVVGADPSNDLAVIQINADHLPTPLPLAGNASLRVGQFVIAIGNPFGLEGAMTMGIISSLGRVIQSPDGRFIGEAIQTDAVINPGNSGDPCSTSRAA